MLTFGSLFAGIGGFDLGLERAGMRCVWQVEVDDYCRRVLAKHWPDVRRHDDVRTFLLEPVEGWSCDIICGGFPCQDISLNGNRSDREGIDGERSGLWSEFARIVRLVRPRFVVVENVAALLCGGMGRVLGDLAALGFDAEWDCLPACAFGCPHVRQRVFIVAYAYGRRGCPEPNIWPVERSAIEASRRDHAGGLGLAEHRAAEAPAVFRGMDDGVPSRLDRLRCLGNAVVPQVAEYIGRRIVAAA